MNLKSEEAAPSVLPADGGSVLGIRGGRRLGSFLWDAEHRSGLVAGSAPSQVTFIDMQNAYLSAYSAYMGSLLQIRDVPEDARRSLKARAAARGQSLNAYLLDLIDREVSRPTVAEVLDRAAQRAERATASAVDVVAAGRAERDGQISARSRA